MSKLLVSKLLFNKLKAHNVKLVTGYPGGAMLPVLNSFYNQDHIKFLLTRTEAGAGHIAEGYNKVSKNKACVLATSGPGSTNLTTSELNAKCDGTPILYLVGQVSTSVLNTGAFQENDTLGTSKPCVKWNHMITKPEQVSSAVDYAFKKMYSGRHGPVLLDLPKNIMSSEVNLSDEKVYIKRKNNKPISKLAPQRFKNGQAIITKKTTPEEIIQAILQAKKPVLLIGQGIFQSDSIKELRYLAELFNIPVVSTIWALGAIPSDHYLSCKFLGMHGVPYANYAVQESDLLIVLGCRLDDRITGNSQLFAPNATIITVEIEKNNINKTIQSNYYINSDCKKVLTKMIKYYDKNDNQLIELGIKHKYFSANSKWYNQIKEWKKIDFSYVRKYNVLQSRHVISTLNKILKAYKDQITVIADVGMHQMHSAQFIDYDVDKVRFITSGGAGTMGFALPASIGIKLALPENKVVCICGDGGFTMSIAEIITAVNNKINIKVFIINNNVQMMVKMWQDKFYNKQFIGIDMDNPSFEKICQAMGCHSILITNECKLEDKLKYVMDYEDGPIVANVITDNNEPVTPMVKPNKGIHEMFLEEETDAIKGDAPC